MMVLEILFWLCLAIITYTYLGYGLLLYILIRIKRIIKPVSPPGFDAEDAPDITLLVTAYNEGKYIKEKILNSLALTYPPGKLKFLFITDGSDDKTPEIVKGFPEIQHLHQPERRGKLAAVQRAMPFVTTPVVVFTDANTMVNKNAMESIARHYKQKSVGAVAGEKRIRKQEKDNAAGAGEGMYWKYESMLKKWDSELKTVVGAAGELFSMRTALFEPVPPDTLIEDFYMSLRIAQEGYKVVYEPEAFAEEGPSASMKEELKRKIRIATGGIQAIVRLGPLLNIFKYGMLSFQYISHRVLRWTLAPLALPVCFISNMMIVLLAPAPLYQVALLLQVAFYILAFAGYFLAKKQIKITAFFVPYYFFMMNYAVYVGFLRYLKGSQNVVWEKAKRA